MNESQAVEEKSLGAEATLFSRKESCEPKPGKEPPDTVGRSGPLVAAVRARVAKKTRQPHLVPARQSMPVETLQTKPCECFVCAALSDTYGGSRGGSLKTL